MAKKRTKPAVDWSDPDNYAFQGELLFDLVLEFLGQRYTKKCKVVYAYTPGDWSFFDLKTTSIQEGFDSCIYHVEVQAVPELDQQNEDGTWKLGAPYWVRFEDFTRDDVLTHGMQDDLLNAVEEKCRLEDAERRRAAGL